MIPPGVAMAIGEDEKEPLDLHASATLKELRQPSGPRRCQSLESSVDNMEALGVRKLVEQLENRTLGRRAAQGAGRGFNIGIRRCPVGEEPRSMENVFSFSAKASEPGWMVIAVEVDCWGSAETEIVAEALFFESRSAADDRSVPHQMLKGPHNGPPIGGLDYRVGSAVEPSYHGFEPATFDVFVRELPGDAMPLEGWRIDQIAVGDLVEDPL